MKNRERIFVTVVFTVLVFAWLGFLLHVSPRFPLKVNVPTGPPASIMSPTFTRSLMWRETAPRSSRFTVRSTNSRSFGEDEME